MHHIWKILHINSTILGFRGWGYSIFFSAERQGFVWFSSKYAGRTSDGGNGNHSVSLPIILIKMKVDQMLPSSYISSLLVSIL